MSRESARQFLIEKFGIEEPTDTQISDFLNSVNGEVQKEKAKADRYKEDADKVKELQAQLEEINNQNLTDIEKANKATESANQRVAELEKTVKQMELLNSLAKIGIVGDNATKLFGEDGSLDTELLGNIIVEREKNAVADFQKTALDKTPNPQGNNGDGGDDSNEFTDKVVASLGANQPNVDILNNYK